MPQAKPSPISELRNRLNRLRSLLSRSRARQVQATSIIEGARELVRYYFDVTRPEFRRAGLDNESLSGLDALAQELLVLTQRAALRASYEQGIKAINLELNGVEVAIVTAHSLPRDQERSDGLDGKERRIAATLSALVPTAGVAYQQACIDLRDSTRLSYRGVAGEIREALREVLDHLAPDADVKSQEGYKAESGQTLPTMKQKVRYILKSRGKNKTVSAAPEDAVQVVEERVGALARSIYSRSSLSAHVGTTKQEVQYIKAYADVVLSELLEIV